MARPDLVARRFSTSAGTSERDKAAAPTPPEDGAAPGRRTEGERDVHLAAEVCDAAESVVAAGLLTARDLAAAERLIDLAPVPESFRDPLARFVVSAARELVTERVVPSPLSVAQHALQRGLTVPVRPPLAGLAQLASEALVHGCPAWAARQVAVNHHRRVIADAGRRLTAAAFADPVELAELVDRQIEVIRAAVAEVTR